MPIDRAALTELPGVILADEPHRREHALEVELPFLQRALGGGFALVPLVVGDATGEGGRGARWSRPGTTR